MLASRLNFSSAATPNRCSKGKGSTPAAASSTMQQQVCRYWMQERCTRRPCRYAHPPKQQQPQQQQEEAFGRPSDRAPLQRRPPSNSAPHISVQKPQDFASVPYHQQLCKLKKAANIQVSLPSSQKLDFAVATCDDKKLAHHESSPHLTRTPAPKPSQKLAAAVQVQPTPHNRRRPLKRSHDDGADGTCKKNKKGQLGNDPILIHNLAQVHIEAPITGLALPISSQTLFSISEEDAAMHAWSCSTGECTDTLRLDSPASCLFMSQSDPDWVFVGLRDQVKVCNLSTKTQQTLPVGSPVLSLCSLGSYLIAGLQAGSILIWRYNTSSASFHPFTGLHGDDSPVLAVEPSLATGSNVVYAGSADGMIRVWDLTTGRCLQAQRVHSDAITRLLTCDGTSILSASRDGTVKFWKVSTHHLEMELLYTYEPKTKVAAGNHGCVCLPVALCGVFDTSNMPILFVAYSDGEIHILELPSFTCRGTLCTRNPIKAMDIGSSHLLFLGSSTGELSVWKWK